MKRYKESRSLLGYPGLIKSILAQADHDLSDNERIRYKAKRFISSGLFREMCRSVGINGNPERRKVI